MGNIFSFLKEKGSVSPRSAQGVLYGNACRKPMRGVAKKFLSTNKKKGNGISWYTMYTIHKPVYTCTCTIELQHSQSYVFLSHEKQWNVHTYMHTPLFIPVAQHFALFYTFCGHSFVLIMQLWSVFFKTLWFQLQSFTWVDISTGFPDLFYFSLQPITMHWNIAFSLR